MTSSEVQKKIDSISYSENRYIHNGALNVCDAVLNSNSFTLQVKKEIQVIKLELNKLSEPWMDWKRNELDYTMLRAVQNCLNSIYETVE